MRRRRDLDDAKDPVSHLCREEPRGAARVETHLSTDSSGHLIVPACSCPAELPRLAEAHGAGGRCGGPPRRALYKARGSAAAAPRWKAGLAKCGGLLVVRAGDACGREARGDSLPVAPWITWARCATARRALHARHGGHDDGKLNSATRLGGTSAIGNPPSPSSEYGLVNMVVDGPQSATACPPSEHSTTSKTTVSPTARMQASHSQWSSTMSNSPVRCEKAPSATVPVKAA
jgi:hypothetical protein